MKSNLIDNDESSSNIVFGLPCDSDSPAATLQEEYSLSEIQITAIQNAVKSLVSGFEPPVQKSEEGVMNLDSLEIEIGLKIEAGIGKALKLIFDAGVNASIIAKVKWSRGDL